ncbi:hypothetical protein BDW62DRAFT_189870 [Aspergillus aurantiobrunneus]
MWYTTCANILESVFCKASRTHYGMLEPTITQASKYTEHESFQSQQSSTAPIPGAETSQAKHYSTDLPDSFETQPSVSALVVESVTSLDPLTTFSQMDEKNSEGEAKIRSLLAPCRAESFDDETAEAELEASVEDLSKAISNAICCGTFDYEKLSRRGTVCKGQTTGKPQRMGCGNWGKELEKLPHKE